MNETGKHNFVLLNLSYSEYISKEVLDNINCGVKVNGVGKTI